VVERISTPGIKNTYTNTQGSKFTLSKRNEAPHVILSDITICGFVFEITL